jgi:DNA gyrase subunit B
MYDLLENGHIYLALPPLYKIKKGGKTHYAKDDEEKDEILKAIREDGSESSRAPEIQRYKGLGEMNPEELWNTTLNPETRNLLKVQYSKDNQKDQKLIHTLMGSDVGLRKDFIISNAINVQNLDV